MHLRQNGALGGRTCACLHPIQHNGAPYTSTIQALLGTKHKTRNQVTKMQACQENKKIMVGRVAGERCGGCATPVNNNHTSVGFAHHANQMSTTRPHQMPVRLPHASAGPNRHAGMPRESRQEKDQKRWRIRQGCCGCTQPGGHGHQTLLPICSAQSPTCTAQSTNRWQNAKQHCFGKASGGGSGCCVRRVQQNHAPQSLPGAQCTE